MNTDYPTGIKAFEALKPRIKYIEQRDVADAESGLYKPVWRKSCIHKCQVLSIDECRTRPASCLWVTILYFRGLRTYMMFLDMVRDYQNQDRLWPGKPHERTPNFNHRWLYFWSLHYIRISFISPRIITLVLHYICKLCSLFNPEVVEV